MNKYTSAINLSGKDRDKIVALEKYFPLLCKLYSNKEENKNKGIRFFTKPVTVLKEDITGFRKKNDKRKYCALALVLYSDLCVSGFLRNKEKIIQMHVGTVWFTGGNTTFNYRQLS